MQYILTTEHPLSTDGQPVLVDVESGQAYGQTDTLPDNTPAKIKYEELSPRKPDKYFGPTAHVDVAGHPLCNQDGDYLHLCELDDFNRLPGINRCRRCERSLGHCLDTNPLSDNQQSLLAEISKRTPDRDSWCPVAELCKNKTSAGWTSLHRSLRRLEVRSLIEKKTDSHNRAFVRPSSKGHSGGEYLLDVYTISE